jgi:hypothetical protein
MGCCSAVMQISCHHVANSSAGRGFLHQESPVCGYACKHGGMHKLVLLLWDPSGIMSYLQFASFCCH